MIQKFGKVSYTDRPLFFQIFPLQYYKSQKNLEVLVIGLKFNSDDREVFINQIDRAVLETPPKTWFYAVYYGLSFMVGLFIFALIKKFFW